jgi:cysteine synthase
MITITFTSVAATHHHSDYHHHRHHRHYHHLCRHCAHRKRIRCTLSALCKRISDVIAGAATMGLEIMQQVKDLDYLVVPAGGGGLVAGLALVAKEVRDSLHGFI